MKTILMSLLSGTICGAVFGFLSLPIPAPPTWAGIAGILGLFLGFLLSNRFRH